MSVQMSVYDVDVEMTVLRSGHETVAKMDETRMAYVEIDIDPAAKRYSILGISDMKPGCSDDDWISFEMKDGIDLITIVISKRNITRTVEPILEALGHMSFKAKEPEKDPYLDFKPKELEEDPYF